MKSMSLQIIVFTSLSFFGCSNDKNRLGVGVSTLPSHEREQWQGHQGSSDGGGGDTGTVLTGSSILFGKDELLFSLEVGKSATAFTDQELSAIKAKIMKVCQKWQEYLDLKSIYNFKNNLLSPGVEVNGSYLHNTMTLELREKSFPKSCREVPIAESDVHFVFGKSQVPEFNEVINSTKRFYSGPLAFTQRYTFDPATAEGKVLVWLSNFNWGRSKDLVQNTDVILLREFGRLYGLDNVPGTIMGSDVPSIVQNMSQLEISKENPEYFELMYRIEVENEIILCKDCEYRLSGKTVSNKDKVLKIFFSEEERKIITEEGSVKIHLIYLAGKSKINFTLIAGDVSKKFSGSNVRERLSIKNQNAHNQGDKNSEEKLFKASWLDKTLLYYNNIKRTIEFSVDVNGVEYKMIFSQNDDGNTHQAKPGSLNFYKPYSLSIVDSKKVNGLEYHLNLPIYQGDFSHFEVKNHK